MADFIVTSRQPTLRIPRVPVEPGALAALYWNGTKAPNGDGVPGGAEPVSYDRPLFGPQPFWLKGMPHLFGGGFGLGGFGEPGASLNTDMGFGRGPFGVGAFGIGGGYFEWQFSFPLRNGVYAIALRLRDTAGNEQAADAVAFSFEVQAVPRPCDKAWVVSLDGDTLTIGFRRSPDFQVVN